MGNLAGKMVLLLLLLSFALSHRAEAGEIIGGHEVEPHSRPFMAYLQIFDGMKNCDGFLIRKDVVMTAAHCYGRIIAVTLGAHNIPKQEMSKQRIFVSRAFPHPGYVSSMMTNDIMLLKLQRNANLTKEVGLLSLPHHRVRLRPGQVCSVAGWGLLSPQADFAATLQEVKLTLQKDQECKSRFPRAYNPAIELCAGDPYSIKNVFKGDSGGPLVCDNIAQGIVSFGSDYGTPPAVYTKISSFLPWIRNTLKKI